MMRTMTHTTQITRTPTIPVIRSPVRLTRSVPRGARASRGPARSPDKAAVAGCMARLWSSLGAHPLAKPSATGSGRPTAVTHSVASDVPVSVVSLRRRAPRATHSEATASCDAFLTIWRRRGLGASRASRRGCALNETRTLHEPARCHDGRCRVPTFGPGAVCSQESMVCPHGHLEAGRGCLRHWKRRSSHAHCPP